MRVLFTLLLLALCAAACSPGPGPSTAAPPARLLLVGVIGLESDDALLDDLPAGVRVASDVLASGMGSSAALAWLDGRPAVEQLRAPRDPLRWAADAGLQVDVLVADPALRSETEWVRQVAAFRSGPPEWTPPPSGLRVLIVGRADLDRTRLATLLAHGEGATLVVVAGVPAAPATGPQQEVGGTLDEIHAALQVPVLAAGQAADRLRLEGRRCLEDVLAGLRPGPDSTRDLRLAHWWNEQGGGVLVDTGDRVAVGGSGREPACVGSGASADAASLIAPVLPRGALLVLLRGSDEADLAHLEILTGQTARWSGWGLEPIDLVEQPSPRYLTLDLAVEPEGDGILIEDWSGQLVDLRLGTAFEDAPLLGTPIRDAGDGRWLGVDALRIAPWSRTFWKLTRPVALQAAAWSAGSRAGLDLLWVATGAAPPLPLER